jgi:predicted nucleotidyltransferase
LTAKPERHQETLEVTYNSERWSQLTLFRKKAQIVLKSLEARNIKAIVHGSIARGDVNKDSDIDIFISNPSGSFQIETALEQAKIPIIERTLIQATPAYAMKAYLEIDSSTTVSFPLMTMRRVEREFYRFSGEINLNQIKVNSRVPGVDKRLMLIQPTQAGHVETSIIGIEQQTAKLLGIVVETVLDRVHALTKRDAVGRTGVFVKKQLAPDETFELALKRLADENPAVRRRLKSS